MTTYVPASDVVKNDYVKFKQHLLAYTDILTNFQVYNIDAHKMCDLHQMDDEIKSSILNMLILCSGGGSIRKELGENYVPSDKQLNKLGSFQTNVWNTWSYFTYAALKYINSLNKLDEQFIETNISKIRWDDQCMSLVCKQKYTTETIKKILNATGLSLTTSTLIAAYTTHNSELIDLHNMPVTPECILAASHQYSTTNFVIDLINQQPLTIDTLLLMILIKQCKSDNFKNILEHVSPTQEHVKLACKHHRIDLIQMLLNYRLTVDVECFELMFFTGILLPSKIIADGIEHFLLAGYQLTYQDVVRLARRNYYVHDINRFNFTFDEELVNACIHIERLMYDNLPFTIESLRLACLKENVSIIETIIKLGNIIPDKQSLINAIVHNRPECIKLLLTYVPIGTEFDAELTYLLVKLGYLKNTTIKY